MSTTKAYTTLGIESEVKDRIDELRDREKFEPTYSEIVDRALDAYEETQ
jgi:hypothetical protein